MSVFSTIIVERAQSEERVRRRAANVQLTLLESAKCTPTLMPAILIANTKQNFDNDQKVLKAYWLDEDLKRVVSWIVRKIVHEMKDYGSITIAVRMRIATAMLNKIVYSKYTTEFGIYMHENMIRNLTELQRDIIDEALPF